MRLASHITNDIFNRALGAYMGFAVGDALGATTEFMLPKEIQQKYGVHDKIIGGGWLKLKKGEVTDDTEMCIALGRSIIDNKRFSQKMAAEYFAQWMKSKPKDIGATVRRGLRDYLLKGRIEAPYSEYAAGNGACMRNLPIILFCLNRWHLFRTYSLQQSHITHNNEWSDRITLIFGEITRSLIIVNNKLEALRIASDFIKCYPSISFSKYKGEASGYIKDTFKTVMHFFFDGTNFEKTVTGIVNAGGDADTNGALGGMIAGAYYGYEAIPAKWIKALNKDVKSEIHKQTRHLLTLGTHEQLAAFSP